VPWRTRRIVYLVVLAALMLAGAIIVWVGNRSTDGDVLAALALVGALAILVVAIPVNGGNGSR